MILDFRFVGKDNFLEAISQPPPTGLLFWVLRREKNVANFAAPVKSYPGCSLISEQNCIEYDGRQCYRFNLMMLLAVVSKMVSDQLFPSSTAPAGYSSQS